MRVVFLPEYDRNPYQRCLKAELAGMGVSVSGLDPREGRHIHRVMRGERADVLHLHWTHELFLHDRAGRSARRALRFLTGLSALRRRGLRLVWTIHNLSEHDERHPHLELWFHRALARLCHGVIVHDSRSRTEVIRLFGVRDERLVTIPHGHFIGAYVNRVSRAEARRRLGIASDAFVYLFLGMIRPYKGLEDLLAAFTSLGDGAAVLLVAGGFAGPADFEASLRHRLGAAARVHSHLGYVADDEVQIYLNAADVLVLPYRRVSTSGSMLLGMSFGKPIVAPAHGGIPELLDGSGGVCYPAGDPQALEAALRSVRDCDLPKMGRRNLDLARTLDWSSIAERTLRIYGGD